MKLEAYNFGAASTQIELALDKNVSHFESPSLISFELYMDMMQQLSKEAEEQEKSKLTGRDVAQTHEFSSSSHSGQNATMKEDTRTKQLTPLVSSQEIGWEKQVLSRPVAGREGSEITKFAAALIKNGVYY